MNPIPDGLLRLALAVSRALESLKIPHMLIGALGRSAWARPRMTTDVDFTISCSASEWPALVSAMSSIGLIVTQQAPPGETPPDTVFFSTPEGIRVDFLIAKTPFEKGALRRRVKAEILGTKAWVTTAEDLIVYKLIAGRPRDRGDIEEVIAARAAISAPLDWKYIRHWASEWGVSDRLAVWTSEGG